MDDMVKYGAASYAKTRVEFDVRLGWLAVNMNSEGSENYIVRLP